MSSFHSYSPRPYSTTKYGLSPEYVGYSFDSGSLRRSRTSKTDKHNFIGLQYSSSGNSPRNQRGLYRSTSYDRGLNGRTNNTGSIHGYSSNWYPVSKFGGLTDRSVNRPSSTKIVDVKPSAPPSVRLEVTVDYKHLYEIEKRKHEELSETLSRLESLANEVENVETDVLENLPDESNDYIRSLIEQIAELEKKNKDINDVKIEHDKLQQENLALIRVMAKLSKSG